MKHETNSYLPMYVDDEGTFAILDNSLANLTGTLMKLVHNFNSYLSRSSVTGPSSYGPYAADYLVLMPRPRFIMAFSASFPPWPQPVANASDEVVFWPSFPKHTGQTLHSVGGWPYYLERVAL